MPNQFKSHKELLDYLFNDKGIVLFKASETYQYLMYVKEDNILYQSLANRCSVYQLGSLNLNRLDFYHKYTEPKWFDNIPKKGILCRCKDGLAEDIMVVRAIYKYADSECYKVNGDYTIYDSVEPLTESEVNQYIYKGDL